MHPIPRKFRKLYAQGECETVNHFYSVYVPQPTVDVYRNVFSLSDCVRDHNIFLNNETIALFHGPRYIFTPPKEFSDLKPIPFLSRKRSAIVHNYLCFGTKFTSEDEMVESMDKASQNIIYERRGTNVSEHTTISRLAKLTKSVRVEHIGTYTSSQFSELLDRNQGYKQGIELVLEADN